MLIKKLQSLPKPKVTKRKVIAVFFILLVLSAGPFAYNPELAKAALLSSTSVELSDSRPSNTSTTYTTTFTFPSTSNIACIDIIFGNAASSITLTTNPATTAPTGMTTTSAAKGTITGGGLTSANWTLYNTNNGVLQYEYATGQASTATSVTITTTGITNPSGTSFYAQVATYSTLTTHTCSGLVDNSNVMALATTPGVSASVTVDPSLTFSVANYGSAVNGSLDTSPVTTTATTIPFGTVAAGSTGWGSQTLTTSTNAAHGYTIYIRYSGAMTDSNNDTFTDQTGTPTTAAAFSGSASTSSFGFTTDSTTVAMGSNKWAGLTTSNVAIDSQTAPKSANAFNIEYKVEPSNTQAPGTYTTTVTYTATPTY